MSLWLKAISVALLQEPGLVANGVSGMSRSVCILLYLAFEVRAMYE